MDNQCRICRFWNFENRLSINSYVDYHLIYNIANILQDPEYCGSHCNRICCQSEIKKYIMDELNLEIYDKWIAQALDLGIYHPHIYIKAIIAESKIGKSQFMNQILTDPVFDNSLNRQKINYLKMNQSNLTSEQNRSLELLEFQSKYDDFSYKYKRIFGNKLQILCLGLMDDYQLEEVMKNLYGKRIQNQIIAFLQPENLDDYLEHNNIMTRLIALAKLSSDDKQKILQNSKTELTDKEQVAIFHDLSQNDIFEYLEKFEEYHIRTPGILKLLNQVQSPDPIIERLDSSDPHIQAASIYLLLDRFPSIYQKQSDRIQQKIIDLIKAHNIFIPVDDFQDHYYEILMDEPDHSLGGFLVNYLTDINLLQKLLFHTNLREKVKERINFLMYYR